MPQVGLKWVMRCCWPASKMASSVNLHPVSRSCPWFYHLPKSTALTWRDAKVSELL